MPGARLSQDEREAIALGLAVQGSFADIGCEGHRGGGGDSGPVAPLEGLTRSLTDAARLSCV
jgi:hypothetical protein